MKKFFDMLLLTGLLAVLLAVPVAHGQMYQTVEKDQAQILQKGPGHLYCPSCGMHLVKFYRTGHALKQGDGATHQYCSLHCLVEANSGSLEKALVVDQASLRFIEADRAFYVLGSDKPGTMTMNSKYAFAEKRDAESFAQANGGLVKTFAEVCQVARGALDVENKKILGKRKKMAFKGAKIVHTMCQDQDWPKFKSIAEAKTYLAANEKCGPLRDEQLQAAAIFLVMGVDETPTRPELQVPEGAKCPVCGMFVAKYPQWAAQAEGNEGKLYYFDGVKDLMKFLLDSRAFKVEKPKTGFQNILVTDYYSLRSLDAEKAFYVIGSNVYGPMGNELIPFATHKEAQAFKLDHAGDKILEFSDITPRILKKLDK